MKKGARIEDITVKAFNSCTSCRFFSPHILVTTSQSCNLTGSTIHCFYTSIQEQIQVLLGILLGLSNPEMTVNK
jgi:hypothetical protein